MNLERIGQSVPDRHRFHQCVAVKVRRLNQNHDDGSGGRMRGGPAAVERAHRAGAGSGGRPEGSGMTRATVSADGEAITVHIPLIF